MGAFLGVVCAAAKPGLCPCPLWSLRGGGFCQLLLLLCCRQLPRPSVSRGGLWVDCGPSAEWGLPWSCWATCAPAIRGQSLAAVSSWSCTPRSYFTFFLEQTCKSLSSFVSQNRVFLCFLVFVVFFFAFCFLLIRSIFISFVFFVLSRDFWLENIGY